MNNKKTIKEQEKYQQAMKYILQKITALANNSNRYRILQDKEKKDSKGIIKI